MMIPLLGLLALFSGATVLGSSSEPVISCPPCSSPRATVSWTAVDPPLESIVASKESLNGDIRLLTLTVRNEGDAITSAINGILQNGFLNDAIAISAKNNLSESQVQNFFEPLAWHCFTSNDMAEGLKRYDRLVEASTEISLVLVNLVNVLLSKGISDSSIKSAVKAIAAPIERTVYSILASVPLQSMRDRTNLKNLRQYLRIIQGYTTEVRSPPKYVRSAVPTKDSSCSNADVVDLLVDIQSSSNSYRAFSDSFIDSIHGTWSTNPSGTIVSSSSWSNIVAGFANLQIVSTGFLETGINLKYDCMSPGQLSTVETLFKNTLSDIIRDYTAILQFLNDYSSNGPLCEVITGVFRNLTTLLEMPLPVFTAAANMNITLPVEINAQVDIYKEYILATNGLLDAACSPVGSRSLLSCGHTSTPLKSAVTSKLESKVGSSNAPRALEASSYPGKNTLRGAYAKSGVSSSDVPSVELFSRGSGGRSSAGNARGNSGNNSVSASGSSDSNGAGFTSRNSGSHGNNSSGNASHNSGGNSGAASGAQASSGINSPEVMSLSRHGSNSAANAIGNSGNKKASASGSSSTSSAGKTSGNSGNNNVSVSGSSSTSSVGNTSGNSGDNDGAASGSRPSSDTNSPEIASVSKHGSNIAANSSRNSGNNASASGSSSTSSVFITSRNFGTNSSGSSNGNSGTKNASASGSSDSSSAVHASENAGAHASVSGSNGPDSAANANGKSRISNGSASGSQELSGAKIPPATSGSDNGSSRVAKFSGSAGNNNASASKSQESSYAKSAEVTSRSRKSSSSAAKASGKSADSDDSNSSPMSRKQLSSGGPISLSALSRGHSQHTDARAQSTLSISGKSLVVTRSIMNSGNAKSKITTGTKRGIKSEYRNVFLSAITSVTTPGPHDNHESGEIDLNSYLSNFGVSMSTTSPQISANTAARSTPSTNTEIRQESTSAAIVPTASRVFMGEGSTHSNAISFSGSDANTAESCGISASSIGGGLKPEEHSKAPVAQVLTSHAVPSVSFASKSSSLAPESSISSVNANSSAGSGANAGSKYRLYSDTESENGIPAAQPTGTSVSTPPRAGTDMQVSTGESTTALIAEITQSSESFSSKGRSDSVAPPVQNSREADSMSIGASVISPTQGPSDLSSPQSEASFQTERPVRATTQTQGSNTLKGASIGYARQSDKPTFPVSAQMSCSHECTFARATSQTTSGENAVSVVPSNVLYSSGAGNPHSPEGMSPVQLPNRSSRMRPLGSTIATLITFGIWMFL